jgi:membrane associated rhomboid family serine protease
MSIDVRSVLHYLALPGTYFFQKPEAFLSVPWTIFTYMFTHSDFWHILANMITLYFYGSFLNRITGVKTFLSIYFIGGLVAGLFILLLSSSSDSTIGASGAIFALGGALAVLTPKLKVFIFPIPVPMPLWVAILIGFLILAIIPGVSWQGHLGGLLTGLAAGWFLRKRIRVIY